jgi:uncharacterized protein
MFVHRQIEKQIRELCQKFPIVSVTSPRQLGKTTLLRNLFHEVGYEKRTDFNIVRALRPCRF